MTEPALRPGALQGILILGGTCVTLAVFGRLLWLVVPGLAALVLYYCLRPAMSILVQAGVRRQFAARLIAASLALLCIFWWL